MKHCKNYFVKSSEISTYEIVTDGIIGTFNNTYVVNGYLYIRGSYVNDGVYKITDVQANKIVLEGTLNAENTGDNIKVYFCAPPASFVSLSSDIEAYSAKHDDGMSSEKLDDYSIAFKNGDSSFTSVFSSRIAPYRKLYLNLGRCQAWQ